METFDDFAGLMRERPGLALAMTAFSLSALGLPPFSRLLGQVLRVQGGAGRRPLTTWSAVVALVGSVVAAFYYLRLIKVMWLDPPPGAYRRARRRTPGRRRLRHRPLRLPGGPGRADLARSLVGDRRGVRPLSAWPARRPFHRSRRWRRSIPPTPRRAAGPRPASAGRSGSPRCARPPGAAVAAAAWETGAGNLAATYLVAHRQAAGRGRADLLRRRPGGRRSGRRLRARQRWSA